jgi:hypothetical protein
MSKPICEICEGHNMGLVDAGTDEFGAPLEITIDPDNAWEVVFVCRKHYDEHKGPKGHE